MLLDQLTHFDLLSVTVGAIITIILILLAARWYNKRSGKNLILDGEMAVEELLEELKPYIMENWDHLYDAWIGKNPEEFKHIMAELIYKILTSPASPVPPPLRPLITEQTVETLIGGIMKWITKEFAKKQVSKI